MSGHSRVSLPTEYSAGGVLVDGSGQRALAIQRISRHGRVEWVLPKGHIEAGETPRTAAEREVFEETGILGNAGSALGLVEYVFYPNRIRTRKIVRHYLLRMHSGTLSTADHEVSDVAWFGLAQLDAVLAHGNERRILRRAVELLAASATR